MQIILRSTLEGKFTDTDKLLNNNFISDREKFRLLTCLMHR